MSREKLLNSIGLLLLAVCFFVSLQQVFSRKVQEINPDTRTISFAHWQLEGGVREAWEVVARAYEQKYLEQEIARVKTTLASPEAKNLKPAERRKLEDKLERMENGSLLPVKIKQMGIPEIVYPAWTKTRIVGESSPHLIALAGSITDELQARYFRILGPEILKPNPYNKGSHHEGVPWKHTFIGGLEGSYNHNLMENFSIPFSMHTGRMFYNQDIFREVLDQPENAKLKASIGPELEPKTWKDFSALCKAIQQYTNPEGRKVVPIAGSSYNAPMLMGGITRSQTSKLKRDMVFLGHDGGIQFDIFMYDFLRGKWGYQTPSMRSALEITREMGSYMKPGFMQLTRDDALFDFVQGTAAMVTTGAWDATSIYQQAYGLFNIGTFRVPMPAPDDSNYGQNVLGVITEINTKPYGGLGIVNTHPVDEQEIALDFLRFATSVEGNTLFSQTCQWLPIITGIQPTERMRDFQPVAHGYPAGFDSFFSWSFPDTMTVLNNQLYLLIRPDGSVDEYIEQAQPLLQESVLSDIERNLRNREQMLEKIDTTLAVVDFMSHRDDAEEAQIALRKRNLLVDSQLGAETRYYYGKAAIKSIKKENP